MKKTIFLNTDYVDTKKISKTEEESLRKEVFKKSIKQFKEQTKDISLKIISESLKDNAVVIDFKNEQWDIIYSILLKAAVVAIIDSQIYESNE